MPAPRTTAWSPIFGILTSRVVTRAARLGRQGVWRLRGNHPNAGQAVWVVPGSASADPALERVRRRSGATNRSTSTSRGAQPGRFGDRPLAGMHIDAGQVVDVAEVGEDLPGPSVQSR